MNGNSLPIFPYIKNYQKGFQCFLVKRFSPTYCAYMLTRLNPRFSEFVQLFKLPKVNFSSTTRSFHTHYKGRKKERSRSYELDIIFIIICEPLRVLIL